MFSVNGKTPENLNSEAITHLTSYLSAEAADILLNIQKTTSSNSGNFEKEFIFNESVNIENQNFNQQLLIRQVPEVLQKALEQQKILEQIRQENNFIKKLTIYEAGIALGIVVGNSEKKEVIQIMKDFSKIIFSVDTAELILFYSDIALTVFFNDSETVKELQFSNNYKGETSKGLKIGDSIEKAIELYGNPRMKTSRGAIWNGFGVFCQNNFISSIRIQN